MQYSETTIHKVSESHEIAKQIEVELALLVNIEDALRVALTWATDRRGSSRKLATLRFVTGTFDRHLAHMRVLAEYGGYMQLISDAKPHLEGNVTALKDLRNELQADLERIVVGLDHIAPDDGVAFGRLCGQLTSFLVGLETHRQREMELLQHSVVQEEGTSG